VRERTMSAHRDAESRPFIVALMKGELSLASYVDYLAQLAWLYEALESRGHHAGDPAILDPRLDRLNAIESDLAALDAPDWRTTHPALPATSAYATHLAGIRAEDLPRYLGHHYTRYLGDLSGGQAISRLVGRHYGATPEQLSYYRFEGITDLVPYKRDYRDALNALPFTAVEAETFVSEAALAFTLNQAIFDELGA
jgi:heme oxygenase